MKRLIALFACVLMVGIASGDPTNLEGGVFIAHHPPGLQFSAGTDWCQKYTEEYAITSCEEQHNRIDLNGLKGQSSVWYVLAAWSEAKEWCGAEFGFGSYDPYIYGFIEWGPCSPEGDLEIPTDNWPGPNEGTAVTTTTTAWSGNFEPVYYFAGYAYYEGVIPLAADPATSFGGTGNCATPPEAWAVELGGMGLFRDGIYVCPEGGGEGGGSGPEGGDDGPDEPEPEDDGGGGLPVAPYIPPDNPSPIVSAYILPTAISFGDRNSGPTAIESVTFNDIALRNSLIGVGVRTIAPEYPHASLADTTVLDTNGRIVKVPDISSFYLLEFEDSTAAIQAISSLDRTSGIRIAEVLTAADAHVTTFPNDPYFDAWRDYTDDAQWFLQNDGEREDPDCSPAVAGEDIQAQGAWGSTLGDSNVVIGIVDTGILGGIQGATSHEDLRVIPLPYDERDSISTHPSCDWCAEHGTLMGGIAAARTNNEVGVAGICGNCSLLDIESAGCDSIDCANHDESVCDDVDPAEWPGNIRAALSLDLDDKVLYVINMSFGRTYTHAALRLGQMRILWAAFRSNRILVSSSGNEHSTTPLITTSPTNAPFVLGVGGSTWDGLFWDYGTSCYEVQNGTTAGYSECAGVERVGRICDICAPASGRYLTSYPVAHAQDSGYYWMTTGQTSGASAQASGAAGLLQSLALDYFSEDLPADDIRGILESTAAPWPADNHPSTYSVCPTCPAEFFGNGILNVAGACALVSDDSYYWRTPEDPDVCERIARKTGGHIVPGTWTFTEVDRGTVLREGVDTTWVEYRAQAEVDIPAVSGPPLRDLPDHVGWVRRLSDNTNTFSSYSLSMKLRIDMMWDGMHDCRLSVIDQETGRATISGYTYAFLDPATQEEHFVVAEDDIQMAYVVLCRYQTSVEEQTHTAVATLRLKGMTNPTQSPIQFTIDISQAGDVQVEIYDVAGRRVRVYDPSRLGGGAHAFSWDGTDQGGERVPAGLYWIQARLADAALTKRLVLVR